MAKQSIYTVGGTVQASGGLYLPAKLMRNYWPCAVLVRLLMSSPRARWASQASWCAPPNGWLKAARMP